MADGRWEITSLLRAWSEGDHSALEKLTVILHDELRRIARRYARREREPDGLQTTQLLNEAYLRLVDAQETNSQDRARFFDVAARIMRRILVDAARTRAVQKLVALDDTLKRLEEMDGRKAKIIELRFFGGLGVEDIADILKISPQTVMLDWRLARAWVARESLQ